MLEAVWQLPSMLIFVLPLTILCLVFLRRDWDWVMGFEAIKILESIVGPSHAKDILFTARFLNTEEALRIGLINFVVSYEEWESTINDYVHKIAANAPLTIKAVKATVAELVRDPGQQSPEYIDKLVNDCFLSDDYKEGRTAFLEKRKANFKGS